ncbi:MAG: hypothetical protein HYY37_01435 [Candidatus Aenigmarchaeota archaeon]|nr:hypothetical protein [Candidatus Aenigmarchaeota archaeon]
MNIKITDLSPDRFFVRVSEDFEEKLDKAVIRNYSSYRKLANHLAAWSGSLYAWRRKRTYPLSILTEICRLCDINLEEMQSEVIELKSHVYGKGNTGNVKSKSIYPRFPIKLTPELSSIIAHLFCDGSLSIEKRGYFHLHYYNTDRNLLDEFKKNARKTFGNLAIYESKNKGVGFVALPTPVGIILSIAVKDFNSRTCEIPEFIRNSEDLDVKKAFIRAFADDEGSVLFNPPVRQIELSCSNRNLLSGLKEMINELEIRSDEIKHKNQRGFDFYYFYIRGYTNLKLFKEKIGFTHSSKGFKLNALLTSKQRISYGRKESKELVLNALKEGKNRKEISIKLNRSLNTIDYHIHLLKKSGAIKEKL